MIDTDEQLEVLLARIGRAGWVALDTEADSLHAYPEKLCLLQISLPGADELVDPLATMEIGPLIEVLRKRELIMHGADYDLRLLRRAYEFVPESMVDTMLAARLLGFTEFGLTSLVEKLLGVRLEKGSQTADWAKRPLTERMINYARNDTRHLKPLWDWLRSRLDENGRLHWHKESCARLVKECAEARPADPDQIWRVKGADRLDRHSLAVLRELWHWRDSEAVAANRPPFFILRHDTLVTLSEAAVLGKNVAALLSARLAQRRREGVLVAVRRGLGLPASQWPQLNRYSTPRSNAGEKRRYEELRQRRDRRAAELAIDPTLIASRATLSALARDWDAGRSALMAWQRELLEK